jgi:thioredoxin reductase (NADPH)
MKTASAEPLDCLVIGGGPAGLTAAVYLARYRRTLRLVDAGESRVQRIPRTRNVLGFPDGVAGTSLLNRMREHAARYGIEPWQARVEALAHHPAGGFEARIGPDGERLLARAVILCTGARDIEPAIEGLHEGLQGGQVRYCPVCDGFETQHQRVAVLGREGHGLREALFVAGFDNEVTWLSMGSRQAVDRQQTQRLTEAGVRVANGLPQRISCDPEEGVRVTIEGGATLCFDVLYPSMVTRRGRRPARGRRPSADHRHRAVCRG